MNRNRIIRISITTTIIAALALIGAAMADAMIPAPSVPETWFRRIVGAGTAVWTAMLYWCGPEEEPAKPTRGYGAAQALAAIRSFRLPALVPVRAAAGAACMVMLMLAVPGTASAEWTDPWKAGKGFDDPFDKQAAQAPAPVTKAQAAQAIKAQAEEGMRKAEGTAASVPAPAKEPAQEKDIWVQALPGAVSDKIQQREIVNQFSNR